MKNQCTVKAKRTGNQCCAPAIKGNISGGDSAGAVCQNLGLDFVD